MSKFKRFAYVALAFLWFWQFGLLFDNVVTASPNNVVDTTKWYRLVNSNQKKVLTIHSSADGANAYGLDFTSSPNQLFKFSYSSTKDAYTIICYEQGSVPTYLSYTSTTSGSNVSNRGAYNNSNIYWKVEGTGPVSIRPLGNTNLAINLNSGYGTSSGTSSTSTGNAYLSTYGGSLLSNFWSLVSTEVFQEGKYYIKSCYSGLYVQGASYSAGAAVVQNTYDNVNLHFIDIQFDGSPYCTFKTYNDLAIQANPGDGNNLILANHSLTNNNQKFGVFPLSNGAYYIRCKESVQAFDVEGPSLSANAPIQTWSYGGYSQQQWLLVPACTSYSTLKVGYTVQNDYDSNCDMSEDNYPGFINYVNGMENVLQEEKTLFKYEGRSSWSNDLKSDMITGGVSHNNIEDVDLMVFTGHGYIKGRSTGNDSDNGEFLYNSLHFGTTNSSGGHPKGSGAIASANFTTYDARYFGYESRVKWLIAYSCNFLETNDANVLNMLKKGGRLILGFSSKMALNSYEGTRFANNCIGQEMTIQEAFFESAKYYQESSLLHGRKYVSCLYYYDDNNAIGTKGDTINHQADVSRKYYYCLIHEIPTP